MAARVAVLGPKGRAKGIDLRQARNSRFDVELAADGEEASAAKEVVAEVGSPVRRGWDRRPVGEIERADRNISPAAISIARRNDGVCTQKNPRSWK